MSKYFLITILSFFITSCSDHPLVSNILEFDEYSGITATTPYSPDPIGVIDAADWNPIPEIHFIVAPAFPNPTNISSSIRFEMHNDDSIKIVLDDRPMNRITTIAERKFSQGTYSIEIDFLYNGEFDTVKRKEGIARIFYFVYCDQKVYKTFGDIKFQY